MLRRRSRAELPPLAEEEVYARSYGDRSDEVTNVKRREPEPERPKRMSDRALRDAFKARLEKREET
ncbi:MAG TPA: hypothetical protein VJQ85_02180 [Gaiellaceae bacterium]|nr:hypothetical protein [Gaiellaceae bacterium]